MAKKFSILIATPRDSRDLARTMFSIFTKTADIRNCEILIGFVDDEQENKDLQAFFMALTALQYPDVLQVWPIPAEMTNHEALNRLAEYSVGEWIIPLQAGQRFTLHKWDDVVGPQESDILYHDGLEGEKMILINRSLYNKKFIVAPPEALQEADNGSKD